MYNKIKNYKSRKNGSNNGQFPCSCIYIVFYLIIFNYIHYIEWCGGSELKQYTDYINSKPPIQQKFVFDYI